MKTIRQFLLIYILSLFSVLAYSQESESMTINNMSTNQVFDNLKIFALENDYFIQKMDRKEGFLQFYYYSKRKGIFTRDHILTINLFVIPQAENKNRLSLQIKAAEVFTDDFKPYYEDIGILPEGKPYTDLLSLITQFFDRIEG